MYTLNLKIKSERYQMNNDTNIFDNNLTNLTLSEKQEHIVDNYFSQKQSEATKYYLYLYDGTCILFHFFPLNLSCFLFLLYISC